MRKQLTPDEIAAVNLATKGESFSHRRWPQDVVAAFAAAAVYCAGEPRRFRPFGPLRLRGLLPSAFFRPRRTTIFPRHLVCENE